MSKYVPGRGFEPDPRGIDRNDPVAMADYERRKAEFYNKPLQERTRLSDNPNYDPSKGRGGGLTRQKDPKPNVKNRNRIKNLGPRRRLTAEEKRQRAQKRSGQQMTRYGGRYGTRGMKPAEDQMPPPPKAPERNWMDDLDWNLPDRSPTKSDQWGSRIGSTGPGTMDFIDSDGDKTDDRYQTGPGNPRQSPTYKPPWEREGWGAKDIMATTPGGPPEPDSSDSKEKPAYGRWQDAELPEIITRATRDLNRGRRDIPGYRGDGTNMGRVSPEYWREDERRGRRGRGGGWWNEPRRPEPRRQYPTELSNQLASDRERTRLLTGEADPISSPVYPAPRERPLREDYDPIDRDFNRQFSEAPRGRQPWNSDSIYNPLERDPLSGYDFREGRYR